METLPCFHFERNDTMNKINGFTITKLTLTGFKCFENTTSFELGDTTLITASNGQGKSSIADAIAFAFVGTPFFGEKSLNRLQNHHMQEMEVRVDFIDDTQKSHNLTRIRKHDTTSICYDGLTVRQSDLNIAFGGKDIFLSIFNPLYFINVLGDTGKNLLEKLLPVVKHEEVLAALSSYSQEILANQSLLSPETFIKNRRMELKKCNETLISYKGQKELLDYQQKERISKLEQLKAEISNIINEMKELTAIRYENIDFDVEKTKLAKLRKDYAELTEEIANNNIEKEMQKMIEQIKEIEKTIMQQNTKQYTSQYTKQIAEMEADLKVLYTEHSKLNTALKNTVVGYQCPVCAAVITEENIATVKTDLQKRLSTLICKGKTAKNNLNTTRIQDNTAKKAFEKQKTAELEKENNKLIDLKLQLQETHISYELDNEENREKLSKIEMHIKEQQNYIANGNWSQEQALQFAELEEKKKLCEAQIETLNNVQDYDYTTLIVETEEKITQLKQLINEAIQYMAKRVELMLNGLKMSHTEIVLTEVIKTTGEIKDCFRFSYDGRDYKCLSLSEKVRAGLDVSMLLQKLSGRNYPIFVDNGESICSFGKVQPSGQVMISKVVNNQTLQVTYKNRK